MLRTNDTHITNQSSFINGNGVKMWRAVGLELRIPYFFISHSQRDGQVWIHDTCLLWRQDDLAHFCKQVSMDESKKIIQLSMLLPNQDNGGWRLEEVREIWSHPNIEAMYPLVLIGQDGTLINKPGQPVRATTLKAKERIYTSVK